MRVKHRDYVVTINQIKHANNELYVCAQVPTTITAISNLAKQHLGNINVALEHQRFCQSYQQIIDAKGWGDFLEIVPCEDENDIPVALFKAATTNNTKKTGAETSLISWSFVRC
ncbi:hypothetical protein DPMN_069082 [Dreissena polymorpha]|uniref:Uncharacterized protein n=1 Tax=Dreissena polymorpha TaxID=45954 RepID=A0A9D3YYT0_DREPO|nr:hypothetical protein DPMN_069082 [Dreissena polymorpha]